MKDINQGDIENNFPLTARKGEKKPIMVGDQVLGGKEVMIIAGPCTLESKSQIMEIAKAAKDGGANCLRGGVFKPLTFPYGEPLAQPDRDSNEPGRDRKEVLPLNEILQTAEKRLGYMKEAGEKYGLPVVSEILYASTVPMLEKYVDMFQVGYRHMFNMDLIEAVAATNKPVLLKRHYGESLRSLLGACEHYKARGNDNIALCERGITVPHTHLTNSRSILDIQAIPALNHFAPTVPVVCDPSHATFNRDFVPAMTKASVAAGADAVIFEIHPTPETAWTDPLNALDFKTYEKLMEEIRAIQDIVRS
jgi:3-deoxy-7-phosphoheptulonate synthase